MKRQFLLPSPRRWLATCLFSLVIGAAEHRSLAVELVTLNADNWSQYAPQGKEADAIYGDYLLRNDQLVAVIARPAERRNANMTVRNVSGCLIDLSQAEPVNDQLSAFYPGGSQFRYQIVEMSTADSQWVPVDEHTVTTADAVALRFISPATGQTAEAVTTYRVEDHGQAVKVSTRLKNTQDKPVTVRLRDAVRADRSFDFGTVPARNLLWAHDEWWRQAYGIVALGSRLLPDAESVKQRRPLIQYGDQQDVTLAPNQELHFERFVFPGANLLEIKAIANNLSGLVSKRITIKVYDDAGPIERALVRIDQVPSSREQEQEQEQDVKGDYGTARTPATGILQFMLPAGRFRLSAAAPGRPEIQGLDIDTSRQTNFALHLGLPGYVAGNIRDEQGQPIACKIELRGVAPTKDPDFGPDTEVWGVHNLIYSENGSFKHEIGPGKYDVLISHGSEYDAESQQIEVRQGETSTITATLRRTVDTSGWVSADFHSHSTPSGDNTSSQLGRVLNLLAEHIEFAPCTEHNRVSTYVPHLERLGASDRMATCPGIELTGSLLPVNHQNAFPLHHHPHTEDGGAPHIDDDPLTQIKRLAMWDDGSDKLLQENHPNIVQIYGDREMDGTPDGGFREMFDFMDVIEVHPPQAIFERPSADTPEEGLGNAIFHWMQLLNLGYRIPGVVNTDAHYTFHGSGWLRNYLKSSTDDPAQIDVMEMVHESEHGHIIMTNGPFMEVSISVAAGGGTALPGDDVKLADGKAKLNVRVQCPNWHNINRVQVFVNGTPDPNMNYTYASHRAKFKDGVVKFSEAIDLALESDAHVIVAAIGEGLTLGPVMGPQRGGDPPIAVSNPIFVDTDGDGFTPNGDLLGFPLPEVPAENGTGETASEQTED